MRRLLWLPLAAALGVVLSGQSAPSQQQVRHVHAGDCEEQDDRAQKGEQDWSDISRDIVV